MYGAIFGLAQRIPQLTNIPMIRNALNIKRPDPSWAKAFGSAVIGEGINKGLASATGLPESIKDIADYAHILYKGHPKNFIANAVVDTMSEIPSAFGSENSNEVFLEDPQYRGRIEYPDSGSSNDSNKESGNYGFTTLGGKYGLRQDLSPKGEGYFGALPMQDGSNNLATEMAMTYDYGQGNVLVPLLNPNLTKTEVNHLLKGYEPTKTMVDKTHDFGLQRLQEGRSPFADIKDKFGFER